MKNCPNCGAPIADNNSFCGNCGTKVEVSENVTFRDPIKGFNPNQAQGTVPLMQADNTQPLRTNNVQQMQYQDPAQMQYQQGVPAFTPQQMYQQPYNTAPHPQQGLITGIKVFMILACIFSAFLIVPLFWMIPMTVVSWKKMDQRQPLGLAFKICTLLFVGIIPGIMMLALNDDMYNYQQY